MVTQFVEKKIFYHKFFFIYEQFVKLHQNIGFFKGGYH
jgi:hypothetical protein